MAIIDFIAANWVQWLFAAAMAVLARLYRNIASRLKSEQAKNAAIAEGVQSLLREAIVSNYNKYVEKNYCPIYAKESMKKVYTAYHNLGGNDVATELYMKILKMKETPDDDEQ